MMRRAAALAVLAGCGSKTPAPQGPDPVAPREAGIEPAADRRCGRWPATVATGSAGPPVVVPDRARLMTDAEIDLTEPLYGDSIDYYEVRISPRRWLLVQPPHVYMTPNNGIYAWGELWRDDFADTEPYLQAIFVHEMMHVWQYQSGLDLFAGWLKTMEDTGGVYFAAYDYALDPDKDLLDYGIEQQASIVEDYFLICAHDLPPGRLTNPPADPAQVRPLYEDVLARFLADPGYARR